MKLNLLKQQDRSRATASVLSLLLVSSLSLSAQQPDFGPNVTIFDPSIINDHAFEVPATSGVQFKDLVTVSLGSVGTIEHVVNETGGTANSTTQVVDLASFP